MIKKHNEIIETMSKNFSFDKKLLFYASCTEKLNNSYNSVCKKNSISVINDIEVGMGLVWRHLSNERTEFNVKNFISIVDSEDHDDLIRNQLYAFLSIFSAIWNDGPIDECKYCSEMCIQTIYHFLSIDYPDIPMFSLLNSKYIEDEIINQIKIIDIIRAADSNCIDEVKKECSYLLTKDLGLDY